MPGQCIKYAEYTPYYARKYAENDKEDDRKYAE
jgi:hypothetical protein